MCGVCPRGSVIGGWVGRWVIGWVGGWVGRSVRWHLPQQRTHHPRHPCLPACPPAPLTPHRHRLTPSFVPPPPCAQEPRLPVISNVDAAPHSDPEVIKQILATQLTAPVQFEGSIKALLERGLERSVEIGPNKARGRGGGGCASWGIGPSMARGLGWARDTAWFAWLRGLWRLRCAASALHSACGRFCGARCPSYP